MPKVAAERLTEIGRALFIAAGTPPAEADIVMRHVVNANLAGHDSHGVIQIPTYIGRIKAGHIVPGAPWVIVQESATTTVVDPFHIFRMLLLPLEEVQQSPRYHPEGDVLYHSLQVFELAKEHRPYDEEFLLAALLHDIGKGLDRRDHVAAGGSLAGLRIPDLDLNVVSLSDNPFLSRD